MKNIKLILMFAVSIFCIPAIVSASQLFPPEIPVLFYGDAKINNNPAPVNTIISVVIENNNLEITSGVIENIGRYFIEIQCKNYINENIIFNLDNFASGQNVCPDVMTIPSVNFDLSAEYKIEIQEEPKEEKKNKNIANSIIFSPTPCVKVIYDDWQTTCVNNLQYRNLISKIPVNCTMTAEQKSLTKKQCEINKDDDKTKVLGVEFYPDGSLIRGNNAKIYLIEDNNRRHIVNLEVLKQFAGIEIFNVADETINLYPIGNKIIGRIYKNGDLIRGDDMKIYVIKNNKEYYIINLKELQKYAGRKIYNINN